MVVFVTGGCLACVKQVGVLSLGAPTFKVFRVNHVYLDTVGFTQSKKLGGDVFCVWVSASRGTRPVHFGISQEEPYRI